MSEVVLSCSGLVKRFGGIVATDHVTLDVARGARHALIGPNGAGKTTLINLLTGVLEPTEGRITLLGEDISRPGAAPAGAPWPGAHLPDQPAVCQHDAAADSGAGGDPAARAGRGWWQPLGASTPVLRSAARPCWSSFHLADVQHQRTEHLAYGKRRLLEIAIALACEPKVLLLDEPVAGVPAGEREELLRTVAALPADVSVLLIEHDMDLVFSFARRITVLVNGAVLTEGTPGEIANDARVKAVYLGQGERCMADSAAAGRGPERRLRRGCGLAGREPGLPEGETLALLGRNGTGKTTLINTLAGATRQHAGRITLAARRCTRCLARARGGRHWLGAAGAQHLQVADGAREPHRRAATGAGRPCCRPLDAAARVRDCSRGWPSARATWAPSCPAASSRCWPWPAPWSSTPACCCWTSRWRAWRPSSWRSCCARLPHHARRRAVGHHRRAASTGHSGHQPPRRGAGPRQRGPHRPCQ
jgi:branched-chain amino acid transport system ATP-binding protein